MPSLVERHSEPEGLAEWKPDHDEKNPWRWLYDAVVWKLFAPTLISCMKSEMRRRMAGLESIDDALDPMKPVSLLKQRWQSERKISEFV